MTVHTDGQHFTRLAGADLLMEIAALAVPA